MMMGLPIIMLPRADLNGIQNGKLKGKITTLVTQKFVLTKRHSERLRVDSTLLARAQVQVLSGEELR